jgi:hypothetical protein
MTKRRPRATRSTMFSKSAFVPLISVMSIGCAFLASR